MENRKDISTEDSTRLKKNSTPSYLGHLKYHSQDIHQQIDWQSFTGDGQRGLENVQCEAHYNAHPPIPRRSISERGTERSLLTSLILPLD